MKFLLVSIILLIASIIIKLVLMQYNKEWQKQNTEFIKQAKEEFGENHTLNFKGYSFYMNTVTFFMWLFILITVICGIIALV